MTLPVPAQLLCIACLAGAVVANEETARTRFTRVRVADRPQDGGDAFASPIKCSVHPEFRVQPCCRAAWEVTVDQLPPLQL
jgi:hypothetical protein